MTEDTKTISSLFNPQLPLAPEVMNAMTEMLRRLDIGIASLRAALMLGPEDDEAQRGLQRLMQVTLINTFLLRITTSLPAREQALVWKLSEYFSTLRCHCPNCIEINESRTYAQEVEPFMNYLAGLQAAFESDGDLDKVAHPEDPAAVALAARKAEESLQASPGKSGPTLNLMQVHVPPGTTFAEAMSKAMQVMAKKITETTKAPSDVKPPDPSKLN